MPHRSTPLSNVMSRVMSRVQSRALRHARLALAVALGLSARDSEAQQDWTWQLPLDRYQRLDLSQRASVDRAQDLCTRGENALQRRQDQEAIAAFRSAAGEWKRFTVEFMDAPEFAMAHAQFMLAFCTHKAKDRHQAIALYTEVLDFYPDTPAVAVPALFWKGQALADNGDSAKALADWTALAEDNQATGHPLVAWALTRLAGDAWQRARWDEAAERWEAILAEYTKAARDTVQGARNNLMMWRALQGRWAAVTELALQARHDARGRSDQVNWFVQNAWNSSGNDWKRAYFEKAFKANEVDARIGRFRTDLVNWLASQTALFEEAGRAWDLQMAVFDYRRQLEPKKKSELAIEIAKALRAAAVDATEKERRARDFIGRLGQAGMHTEARTLLDLIGDPLRRLWVGFDIEVRAEDYKAALFILGQLEKQPDPEVVRRAKRTRADLYKDRTNECDKAIPLYLEVADPPGTLWALQECFWRIGKKSEAQQTLTEIASIFPPEAARAMFQKAEYFRRNNQKAEAIAHYRRILGHPDWKKSPESSRAHQALEQLGVETGGAVLHDVN